MQEREIFETALEISNPGSRQTFLARACGGDAALRARLEALLAATVFCEDHESGGGSSPNPFGLCDMHGNVWEFVQDVADAYYYSKSGPYVVVDPQGATAGVERVIRGGSWRDDPAGCRSAFRWWFSPRDAWPHVGFRVALSLEGVRQAVERGGATGRHD